MPKYSVTLNFFMPKKIVEAVKKINISENLIFDWRREGFFHCTVKALESRDTLPSEQEIKLIIDKVSKIIANQNKFKVVLEGVGKLPSVFYAKIYSSDLVKLHKELCKVNLQSINKRFEDEDYIPHASLVSLPKPSNKIIRINKKFGEFIVDEIQLVVWDIYDGHKPKIYHLFNLK